MEATPSPVSRPPPSSARIRPPPYETRNRPVPTTTMATSAEATVSQTSYLIWVPSTSKPIMAMKCMTQMPVPPMEMAAPSSQRTRAPPREACACAVSRSPSIEPMQDMTYASNGVISP